MLRATVAAQSERARLAQLRYDHGASPYLEVLDAQRDLLAAQQKLAQTRPGARGALFAPDALTVIHELTGGMLRSIDVLADASLRVAAHQKKKLVDRAVVRAAFPLTPLA